MGPNFNEELLSELMRVENALHEAGEIESKNVGGYIVLDAAGLPIPRVRVEKNTIKLVIDGTTIKKMADAYSGGGLKPIGLTVTYPTEDGAITFDPLNKVYGYLGTITENAKNTMKRLGYQETDIHHLMNVIRKRQPRTR